MLDGLGLYGLLILIGSLLVSMVIHEFMHAYVGYRLGDTTARDEGRLTLNPLSHIDPFMTVLLPAFTLMFFGVFFAAAKPVPFNPGRVKYNEYGAALIAGAGPLSNLLLAIVSGIILKSTTDLGIVTDTIQIFMQLNVMLFVFNLMPIPPLDGSRVLYAFSPRPLQEFLERIEPIGFFVIIALVMLGGFGGFLSEIYNTVLQLIV